MTTIENQTGTASGQAPRRLPGDLSRGHAEMRLTSELHCVEAGGGPLVVLLPRLPRVPGTPGRQQIGPCGGGVPACWHPRPSAVTQLLTDFFTPALPATYF